MLNCLQTDKRDIGEPPAPCAWGDFLDKPLSAGGLASSRYTASAVLLVLILLSTLSIRQRAARVAH